MNERLETRIFIFGTLEAVSEGAMMLWRSPTLSGRRSEGIKAVAGEKGLYEFQMECEVLKDVPGSFAEYLSKRVQGTLVGVSVAAFDVFSATQDTMYWGASAHIDGVEVVSNLTGSNKSSLPLHIAERVDDSQSVGVLPADALEELHEHARARFSSSADCRLVSAPGLFPAAGGMPVAGFPRWSLLTHTTNASGLDALATYASTVASEKHADVVSELVSEASRAYATGLAGWPDTLFLGARTPSRDDLTRPFSDADVAAWPERALVILRELGDENNPIGSDVLEALAHPTVSFQDGTHVGAWLASLRPQDEAALTGLRKLASFVGTTGLKYEDDLYASAKAAVATSGYLPEAFDIASRMGGLDMRSISDSLLLAHALNSSEPGFDHAAVANKLFDCLLPRYGRFADFPDEVVETLMDSHPAVAAALEAKKTEEQMRSTLESWTGSHRTPAQVPVVTKRRRQVV